ncbi:MAG: DUF1003 domain-containing protein [Burkholderiales bacterium]|nr:DUF1003 domain-containing protein [Burkholderiales bacterium]
MTNPSRAELISASGGRLKHLLPHPPIQDASKSAEALTQKNVQTIIGLERAAKASISTGEHVASLVARFCGSISFVSIHFLCFSGWIFLNTSPIFLYHPDPFPFTFLTLTVALESIFLSSFLLIRLRHETLQTEQRSHLDLQISLLIEQENTKMLKMLKSIAAKVGAEIDADADLAAMEESTRPEQLLEQIEKAAASERSDTNSNSSLKAAASERSDTNSNSSL